MSKTGPHHHDAELILKLYDLRREQVMRDSRNAINAKFWPKSYEDFLALTKPDHPLNAAFRQTSSYWEMVYGMAKHNIVHGDYLVENNGEGLFLYAKIQPYLERFRKEQGSPTAFQNAEWIAKNTEEGKKRFETIQNRVKKMAEIMGR
jgi:hypothetical protein